MRKNKAFMICIIVLSMVMVLGILGIGNVVAQGPGGPHVIAGRVYKFNGKSPGNDEGGAYAAVIVEHNGQKSTYADHNGIEQNVTTGLYWYAVTIPEGAWDVGDKYWIWIDGSGWGDENFTCIDHDDEGVNSWEMTLEPELRDVNTGDYNFKPLISMIFALILAVMGIMVGILRPLRIPFSGRPRQPADLVDEMMITGIATIPEPLPVEEPAAAAPAEGAEEERICATCGGKMEFIPEYDNWYCYTCKKYPDEEEETPPPEDDDLPPPDEDSLPPPEGGA